MIETLVALLKTFLAGLLLATPNPPDVSLLRKAWPLVQMSLRESALQLELMDTRETHLLARPDKLAADLKELHRRYVDLRDAPPLRDVRRFPKLKEVNDLLEFNRKYCANLQARLDFDRVRERELRDTIDDTLKLRRIWEAFRDAHCDSYYVTARRRALKLLRNELGPQYYAGTLPPYVPLWRFERID